MKIWRTFDPELIRSIITNRWVYRHVSDDGSPNANDFKPFIDDSIIYLAVPGVDSEAAGIFMLHQHNLVCFEVHTCMTPKAWGLIAREAAQEVIEWMFNNTTCERIITNVPSLNKVASRFAIDCGMVKFGVNEKSFLKDGVLFDQIMYGISKGDWLCRSQQS